MRKWPSHVVVGLILLLVLISGAATALHTSILDWRFKLRTKSPSGEVVIVAIDAPSIEKLGVWPWPRTIYADLLDRLREAGATEVAFDVDLSSRTSVEADRRLARALRDFGGGAILPVFQQVVRGPEGPRMHVSSALPDFADHAWLAAVNVVPSNGIVRRYPTGGTIEGTWVPSLAALLTGTVPGTPGNRPESFVLDFSIDPHLIPAYAMADVLSGKVAREIKGKKIIVGATAIELGDRFTVPRYGTIAGVEVQALAAEAFLAKRVLQESSTALAFLGLLPLMLLAFWLHRLRSTLQASAVMLGVALAIEAGAILLQGSQPIALNTALWHVAIASYVLVFWIDELDLRRLLAVVAQKKFQSIAMALGDGVIGADAKGVVTFWNPAAVAIFDYPVASAIGRPITQFIRLDAQGGCAAKALEQLKDQATVELVGLRRDGSTFPLEVRLSSWEAEEDRQYGAIVRDISARKKNEARIRYLALNDELTGLANRTQLWEQVKARIAADQPFAVLLLDLDNFKDVNDALGHEGGDRLLRRFADRLTTLAADHPGSLAARLGGDEFAFVVSAQGSAFDGLVHAITEIFGAGDRLTHVDGRAFSLSASIGAACFPVDGSSEDELLLHADIALYRAKNAGGAQFVAYDPAFKAEIDRLRNIETELRSAINERALELHYQPQSSLQTGRLVGVEALLRWRHPVNGLLAPVDFLPVLEKSNMAQATGEWILRTACMQGAAWLAKGHELSLGVNLFPCQFTPQLPALIKTVLDDTGFRADLLEIEITENILLSNDEHTITVLSRIRDLGVRVALDDFGTGYASLTYLKRFPLDRIKIDRSFVTGFGFDTTNTAIVTAIVGLSRQIGLSTIAEGIEDKDCETKLRLLGCDEGQGYLYGKPVPAAAINARLEADKRAA